MAGSAKTPAAARDAAPTPPVTRTAPPEQRALPLAPADALAARPEWLRARPVSALWLCLYLPSLPLEALGHRGATPLRAVFEEERGLRRVLLASPEAHAAGIRPGLSVNAALALVPGLQPEARDAQREQRVLRRLAGLAERFTSYVVVEPPAALLLEVAASLRLFEGLDALRRQVLEAFEAQGVSVQAAIAPTPLAAAWLARANDRRCIRRHDQLAGALGRLPLRCLDWPAAVTAALQGMGITAVGDCLRLPREGFARRFGASRLLQLDRALGRMPDPRESHRTPERFCVDYDFDEERDERRYLLGICERLLLQLERFLLTRQLAVQRLRFVFYHLQAQASSLTLGSVQAERRTAEWLELLSMRLERTTLPAPVIAIRLQSGHSQPWTAPTAALDFERTRCASATAIEHLVERLGARIGTEAVHGVDTVAEHRPDYAWRIYSGDSLLISRPVSEQCRVPRAEISKLSPDYRPLWMLDAPERLDCRDGQPCYGGPLSLRSGPERIETGWWDEAGIARDYYVAVNPAGIHLWVFRHRGRTGGWYLHGIFG